MFTFRNSVRIAIIATAGLFVIGGRALVAQTPTSDLSTRTLTFSKPTEITNHFLPLAKLNRDVLEGAEAGKKIRIERTMKPGTRMFTVDGKQVAARIMEDREFANGKLVEVTLDYFAQADDGAVCYMGEAVDMYRNGKVVGHEGAWMTGEHNAKPGIIIPGHPKVGDKFHSENVSGIAVEADEVVSLNEIVRVPAGTFKHCVKIKEMVPGENAEYKYYAPGVGVVREVPHGSDVHLVSHK